MMVDVSIASGDKEAVVTEVVETPEKNKYKVTCKVQGKEEPEEFEWPGSKIDFCAAKLPERDCSKKSKDPEIEAKWKATICFSQHAECAKGE